MKLCSFCVNSLRKKKIPKLSIADGYDYGRIERLPEMQSLTLVEKHLIALIRLYITEVKLVAPLGDSISATGSSTLIGNIICFPHDGPKAAAARLLYPATFPWMDDILDVLTVTFIGTDKQYDHYMKHAFGCAELKVRGPVVISWLKMLKVINPLYAGVLIDDSPASLTKLL